MTLDTVPTSRGWDERHSKASPVRTDDLLGIAKRSPPWWHTHRRRPVEGLRTQVENAITPLLAHGRAQVSEVARALAPSQRTLARRLKADGLSFSRILDDLRADLARRYLADPALTVSQIAMATRLPGNQRLHACLPALDGLHTDASPFRGSGQMRQPRTTLAIPA
jgi:AraC-like DNA-binding protein